MDCLESEFAINYSQIKRKQRYDRHNTALRRKRLQRFQLHSDHHEVNLSEYKHPQESLIHIEDECETRIPDKQQLANCEHDNIIEYLFNSSASDHDNIVQPRSNDSDDTNYYEICSNSDYFCTDTYVDQSVQSNEELNSYSSNKTFLHHYTSIPTNDYCENFALLCRQAHLCKTTTNSFLSLIKSGLPTPNHMPSSEEQLLALLEVENLFTKRCVCLICNRSLNPQEKACLKCCSANKTSIAYVYDTNIEPILKAITTRLSSAIIEYREKINNDIDQNESKDVPFGILYQQLLKKNYDQNIISFLLHIDGISITQSTKLKLWMFSGAILELPPSIRYRRFNMALISIWIGYVEPPPELWLQTSIENLYAIKNRIIRIDKFSYRLQIYGITGDCPALKLICNFNGHGGYYCCYFCFIKGQHINRKRQYRYESLHLRTVADYSSLSRKAELTNMNQYGHLGRNVLERILDVNLPHSIVLDYLHVTLLGHAKAIILSIYHQLKPRQRQEFDSQVKKQYFPHVFHRKIRPVEHFAYVKGTEVRNLLFYGLLSNLDSVLPINQLAHLTLYICFIRLLHHGNIFGEHTSTIANNLFVRFYQDHELFYSDLQNFKLHLHHHYPLMYNLHGALSNVNCFGPEDLIGAVSKNHHGTTSYGDSITHYYNIEFHLQNKKQQSTTISGPRDLSSTPTNEYSVVKKIHSELCGCDQLDQCCSIYRRFVIHDDMFHSLIYQKRQNSISYFVKYWYNDNSKDFRFGVIELFFVLKGISYAAIRYHRIKRPYSDLFKESTYYSLLYEPLDSLYFVLEKNYWKIDIVETTKIINHVIMIECSDELFVTNYSSYEEHD